MFNQKHTYTTYFLKAGTGIFLAININQNHHKNNKNQKLVISQFIILFILNNIKL